MRRQAKKFAKGSRSDGSALILTVVLTSMLAIMGVLFVMMARVNQIATSGISESRELDSAIETVIAKISDELVLDVPHNDPCRPREEYYDYPDVKNAWLASLEPYDKSGVGYCWRQISDVTGFLADNNYDTDDVDVDPPGLRKYIPQYPKISVDSDGEFLDEYGNPATEGVSADADGDGVADSKWIELDDITSSKGRPIYAAIRIVDNGGMLNVNTAYKFDPNDPTATATEIDGSSLMQINLMALAGRDNTHTNPGEKEDRLWGFRCGSELNDIPLYEQSVIWQYLGSIGAYTPFDIGDELKLRNRYILNYNLMTSRIERLWTNAYDGGPEMPLPTDDYKLSRWLDCTILGTIEPNDYDYRHISTTYNMDRIINPSGGKMVNVNTVTAADANAVYSTIREALTDYDSNFAEVNEVAAQITANLIDYVDGPNYPTSDSRYDPDNNITVVYDDANIPYYGFERPCVYISELAHNFKRVLVPGGTGTTPGIDYITYRSYAIELHKPYSEDPDPNQWQLSIESYPNSPISVDWLDNENFHVILFQDPCEPLDVDPNFAGFVQEPPFVRYSKVFENGSLIELQRRVGDANDVWLTVDSMYVPDASPASGWLVPDPNSAARIRSVQRDITLHKCIRRLWAGAADANTPTLGAKNNYWSSDPNVIQAHPEDRPFTNVGEIGMLFRKSAYSEGPNAIGPLDTEATARINLADPYYQNLFQYLAVIDPYNYYPGDANYVGETRIKGRININTAPWFVLAQLPWVSQRKTFSTYELAKEIVGYRDETGSFESIGQLCQVGIYDSNDYLGIDYYSCDYAIGDQTEFPDLTPNDGAADDFEERDLIFARISNLVTVRSDVFTAYILVRIGTDGPQKRVIAILDRSDVYSPTDRVKIVAVHPVADPR